VALATGLSRRAADRAIASGLVTLDGEVIRLGQEVDRDSDVRLSGKRLSLPETMLIMLNKPPGYVVSRDGQGSRTIYELLPKRLASLKPVGRLDKNSSGLLLLTNDGLLAQTLTHPKYGKTKIYQVKLDKDLTVADQHKIEEGVKLSDGVSQLQLTGQATEWQVSLGEGRNRQIRRTFEELGYRVVSLHRTHFGPYELKKLRLGDYIQMSTSVIL
jgi:23S rRNA pseudouridine2605 synthase